MGSGQSMLCGEAEELRCDEVLECRELTEDCCECYTGMERHKRLVTGWESASTTPLVVLPVQSRGCKPSSHFGAQQPLQPRTFQRHQSLLRPVQAPMICITFGPDALGLCPHRRVVLTAGGCAVSL